MRIDSRLLIGVALLAIATFACDTREDPNLLNPPPPDSSQVRVVNLLADDAVDVGFPFIPVVTGLAPLQTSDFQRVLVPGQTITIAHRPARTDTLGNQSLAQGARITYFVLGTRDTSVMLRLSLGKQDSLDLTAHNERYVSFINAIPDSGTYYLKVGCQSGTRIFEPTAFAQSPATVTVTSQGVSLYLFNSRDSSKVLATARIDLNDGSHPLLASYVIAALQGGVPKLFILHEDAAPGPLAEALPETRTTASVELLNGLAGPGTISAHIDGTSSNFATGVMPMTISLPTDVEACLDPNGDSLVVTPSDTAAIKVPIHLSVGTKTLVAVYRDADSGVHAVSLSRDLPSDPKGKVHLRGINVATRLPSASISIGAGAPPDATADSRPFGSLRVGAVADYVELSPGIYPLMLTNGNTGQFLSGGVQTLNPGYYTLVVIDVLGLPTIALVRDDLDGAALAPIANPGSRGIFFSLLTDVDATFSTGPLVLPALPYSYVYTTVLPINSGSTATVTSNAGSTTIDPTLGGYLIGASGSGNNKKIVAVRTATDSIPPKDAALRILNAVPDGPQLAVRVGGNHEPVLDSVTFGNATVTRLLDARQYSMFVTAPNDTIILARADGIELSNGRRYVLVIGPKRQSSTSEFQYELLWVQE